MTGKRCGTCCRELPLTEFHRRGRGYQSVCKECRRAYDARYHAARAPIRRRQARETSERFREWYWSLKERPCMDCGGTFHPAAMQWDHLPGSPKRADLGRLANRHSREAVLAEIAKCELVCANCHAVRTYRRRGV